MSLKSIFRRNRLEQATPLDKFDYSKLSRKPIFLKKKDQHKEPLIISPPFHLNLESEEKLMERSRIKLDTHEKNSFTLNRLQRDHTDDFVPFSDNNESFHLQKCVRPETILTNNSIFHSIISDEEIGLENDAENFIENIFNLPQEQTVIYKKLPREAETENLKQSCFEENFESTEENLSDSDDRELLKAFEHPGEDSEVYKPLAESTVVIGKLPYPSRQHLSHQNLSHQNLGRLSNQESIDRSSKQDTSTYTFLAIDAVQTFKRPPTLRFIDRLNFDSQELSEDLHNKKDLRLSSSTLIMTNVNKESDLESEHCIEDNPLLDELEKIDFRAEYNSLLKYHLHKVEKLEKEAEAAQKLLDQQKLLNDRLILGLASKSTSKANTRFRKTFIPMKISSPSPNKNHFDNDEILHPQKPQLLSYSPKPLSSDGFTEQNYPYLTSSPNLQNFMNLNYPLDSPASSYSSFKDDKFDVFTVDSNRVKMNASLEDLLFDEFDFCESPKSHAWQDKPKL